MIINPVSGLQTSSSYRNTWRHGRTITIKQKSDDLRRPIFFISACKQEKQQRYKYYFLKFDGRYKLQQQIFWTMSAKTFNLLLCQLDNNQKAYNGEGTLLRKSFTNSESDFDKRDKCWKLLFAVYILGNSSLVNLLKKRLS